MTTNIEAAATNVRAENPLAAREARRSIFEHMFDSHPFVTQNRGAFSQAFD
jgi:hypothetical protein